MNLRFNQSRLRTRLFGSYYCDPNLIHQKRTPKHRTPWSQVGYKYASDAGGMKAKHANGWKRFLLLLLFSQAYSLFRLVDDINYTEHNNFL